MPLQSEFGNKISFTEKAKHCEENSQRQAKKILGFEKHFSEFMKGIYETCNHNFFNLAFIIVFFNSTIHIIFTFC